MQAESLGHWVDSFLPRFLVDFAEGYESTLNFRVLAGDLAKKWSIFEVFCGGGECRFLSNHAGCDDFVWLTSQFVNLRRGVIQCRLALRGAGCSVL